MVYLTKYARLAQRWKLAWGLSGCNARGADRVWTMLTTDWRDRVLDVFDTNGAFIRRVAVPVAIRPSPQPVVRGNLLYGVEFGEFDEPYVVVLRIGS